MKIIVAWAAALLMGCTQLTAFFPELDKIEQIVATDLAAGKTPEQIEADVVTSMCPTSAAPLCVDGVVVLNDVVTWLIDSGVLKGQALANAKAVQSAARVKLAARK